MKKTLRVVLSFVLLIVMFTYSAFTQVTDGGGSATKMPTTLAFLSSRAVLRAFATESARQAYLEISSAGMRGTWGTGSSWEAPLDSRGILAQVNAWKFSFIMENPKDYVEATVEIKNDAWDTLFHANSWQTPEAFDSPTRDPAYRLPELYFYFQMAEFIPFKVDKGIQWGQIKYLNDDGRTITTVDLTVRNGKVYFRSDLAGKGILVLGDYNGNTFLYNLRNGGNRVPIANVQYSGSHSHIENLPTFNDPSFIDYKVWSWDGVGQNPTFEVTMTENDREPKAIVKVRTYTSEGVESLGVMHRQTGSTNWVFYPVVSPAKYVPVSLLRGMTHYLVPVWNLDEFKESEPYIPEKGVPVGIYPGKG